MARPRFHKSDPIRQEAILQAAAKEFAHVGYEGASINRIILAAGLSKGAFYYYFDDKADLACTVLLWTLNEVLAMYDRIELPADGAKFWDAISQFTRESLALLERVPHANELMSRLGHAFVNDQDLAERVRYVLVKPTAAAVGIWTRGQELGVVRPDLPAQTLIAICQGIKEALTRVSLPDSRVLTKEELERLTDLQLDLFRRVSEPRKEESR